MIEIWQEGSSFQKTSQRLADQVRTMIKKGWFSDPEILEIHRKINNRQVTDTVPDTSNTIKQKQFNWNEPPTSENWSNTQVNNTEQTLTQEEKVNLESLKRIMNGEKDYLNITRKHLMDNSQDENWKNKSRTNL